MKKTLLIVLSLSIALGGCSATVTTEQIKKTETFKIGVILPLSGNAEAYGTQEMNALNFELNKINNSLKDDNKNFKLIFEDGKCNGNEAVTAFQKLTEIDNVKVILGGACSSETLAIAPLATENKILTLSTIAQSPEIEGASPYLWTLAANNTILGETIADQMAHFKKVAVITEQTDFTLAIENSWEQKIKQHNEIEIVANETFPTTQTDFRDILAKIKKSQPNAIFLVPNVGTTAENLLKQMGETENEWKDIQILSYHVYMPDKMRESASNIAENMVLADLKEITDSNALKILKDINDNYGSIDQIGQFYALSTVEGLDILTSLILKFNTDTTLMQKEMQSQTFKGITRDIYFGDNSFSQNLQMGVYTIKNGKTEPIK